MTVLRHVVTYQGYPCTSVAYSRNEGLSPDTGYVDISLKHLRVVDLKPRVIPWRARDKEIGGGITIHAWQKLRGTVTGYARPLELPDPVEGLNHFGALKMKTFDADQLLAPEVIYDDVYVDSTGIEEITRDLAFIKRHDRGTVRVPLTDIRRYYPNYGPLFGRINIRLHGGKWDDSSLDNGRPFTMANVIPFLFSQLPGTPNVHPSSAVFIDPEIRDIEPTGINAEGEPAYEWVARLLDQYGLVAKFLPTGHDYLVTRKSSDEPAYGKVFSVPDVQTVYPRQHYETASAYITDRPSMVQVFGQRVIRRITLPYAPVIRDIDGFWFRLSDIERVWPGISLEYINGQVFNDHELNFDDIPGENRTVQEFRRNSLRAYAYKAFAPVTAFDPEATGAPVVRDADLEALPFMPLGEFGIYVDDLEKLGERAPQDQREGNRGQYVVIGPVVRGITTGPMMFEDFERLEQFHQEKTGETRKQIQDIRASVERLLDSIRSYAATLRRADTLSRDLRKIEQDTIFAPFNKYVAELSGTIDPPVRVNLNADQVLALRELGESVIPKELLKSAVTDDVIDAIIAIDRVAPQMRAYLDDIQRLESAIANDERELEKYREVYAREGIIPLDLVNLPHGVIPEGQWKLDAKTGILKSEVPLCWMDKPFAKDRRGMTVSPAGPGVIVTAGYEMQDNTPSAITNVLMVSSEDDEVVMAGIQRPGVFKAYVMREPEMRLYVEEEGSPINTAEVESAARGKAKQILSGPFKARGFSYTFSGFVPVVLGGGTNSVQHLWFADAAIANTFVTVNNPGARGPVGSAFTEKPDTPAVEAREQILSAKGD